MYCVMYGILIDVNELTESIPFLQSNSGSACLNWLSISLLYKVANTTTTTTTNNNSNNNSNNNFFLSLHFKIGKY